MFLITHQIYQFANKQKKSDPCDTDRFSYMIIKNLLIQLLFPR